MLGGAPKAHEVLSECGERSAEYFVLSDDTSGRCNQNLSGGGFNFGENEHSQPAAVNADSCLLLGTSEVSWQLTIRTMLP